MRAMPLLASLMLLPLVVACPNERRHERREVRTLALKSGGEFRLQSFNGSIHVTTWDKEEVEVEALIRESKEGDVRLVAETGSGTATFRAERGEGESRSWDFFGRSAGVRLNVRVPKQAHGRLETSNGAISVRSLHGRMDARTSNGRIEVHELGGDAVLRTSNGSLQLDTVQGAVDASTSNGSVEANSIQGKASLRTSNGRVRVADVAGPVVIDTSNGSVRAERIADDLRAETSNGRMEIRDVFGKLDAVTSNGSIEARGLDGKGRGIRLRTSNASISVTLGAAKGEVFARAGSHGRVSIAQKESLTVDGEGATRARIGDSSQRIELTTSHGSINID